MASLSVRVDLAPGNRLGPGKVDLLEQIAASGSISAAGRAMNMSYRRAWELVEELNRQFAEPLVSARTGGRNGGGTALTPLGEAVVAHYRTIEQATNRAVQQHLDALEAELAPSADETSATG